MEKAKGVTAQSPLVAPLWLIWVPCRMKGGCDFFGTWSYYAKYLLDKTARRGLTDQPQFPGESSSVEVLRKGKEPQFGKGGRSTEDQEFHQAAKEGLGTPRLSSFRIWGVTRPGN